MLQLLVSSEAPEGGGVRQHLLPDRTVLPEVVPRYVTYQSVAQLCRHLYLALQGNLTENSPVPVSRLSSPRETFSWQTLRDTKDN